MRHRVECGVTLKREKAKERLIGQRKSLCNDSTCYVTRHACMRL